MGYPGDNNQPSWHGANASDNGRSGAPASSDPAAPVQGSPWPQEQPSSWDAEPSWMQQPAQGGAWPPADQQPAQGGWPEQQQSPQGGWPEQSSQGGWPEQPAQGGAWPPADQQPAQGGWPDQQQPAQGGWPEQPEVPQNPWLNAPPQAPSGTQQPYDGRSGPQQQFEGTGSQPAYEPQPFEQQPWSQQPNHQQWPNETLSAGPDRAPLGRGRAPVGRKKSNRTPVLIGSGVVGALLLAGGGYVLMNKSDEKKTPVANSKSQSQSQSAPAASAQPSSPAPAVKTPVVPASGKTKSKATDPRPLTFKEVFTKRKFTAGGVTYTMTARSSTACNKAVHGVKLLAAMKGGKCSQFLRGTFATGNGKLIGTIGIANLSTAAAANAASTAGKAKDAYLIALPAKGLTAKIGQGQALGEAQARGHYLIMSWVQLPNGKKIPTGSAAYKIAQAFVQNVIVGSNVSPALHARDETGKPWQPR